MTSGSTRQRPLILFDGVCNLCNSAVRWVIERDRADDGAGASGQFDFASLQSKVAHDAIRLAGGDATSLPDSIVLIDGGRVLTRSDAALGIARRLGFPWRALGRLGSILPRGVRDAIYDWVARNRYRWFGRRDACMAPNPGVRARFLDAAEWPEAAAPSSDS